MQTPLSAYTHSGFRRHGATRCRHIPQMKEGPMREQAALSNAPEGYLDFHDEYAELIAELAALGFTP